MTKTRIYKRVGKVFLFLGLNLCVTVGIIWVAYNNRTRIKKMLDHPNSFSKEDKIILYDIFSSPLIEDKDDLVLPPVQNSDELIQRLNWLTIPNTIELPRVYDSCEVISVRHYRRHVLEITYRLFNDTLDSYVYVTKSVLKGKTSNRAVIHLPGSGDNRSGKVARRELDEEDPTMQAEQIGADIYFPIYPADDILAIHDGKKMLDIKKVASYLVSTNRNLSLRHLADIFALRKWLEPSYSVLHLWGHSRGGNTAAVAASILLPDTLIVSSGYSARNNKFFRLNADQLWWPNSIAYMDKGYMKNRFCQSRTKAFFLFGDKEIDDIYGLERNSKYTENYFKDCQNIQVKYVEKKHVWFSDEISKILSGK